MNNVRLEGRFSAVELRSILIEQHAWRNVYKIRLYWFGHLKGMEESAWINKCGTFKIGDSLNWGYKIKDYNSLVI